MEQLVQQAIGDILVTGKLKKEHVAIDCGHIPVRKNEQHIHFGDHNGNPTETQLMTLDAGIFLFQKMKELSRSPKLSICFADTTKFIQDISLRKQLSELCEKGEILELLPSAYQEKIEQAKIQRKDLVFSLQTKNSNKFSVVLKKSRMFAKKKGSEKFFSKYGGILLSDTERDTLGFANPFLLSPEHESQLLKGDWWLDSDYEPHPQDLLIAPLLRLKRLGIVKLFSKSKGILCPATYAGLLLNFDNTYDHIAIYARQDDEFVAEKVLRGYVAALALVPEFNRSCISIALPNSVTGLEVAHLSREVLHEVPLVDNYAKFLHVVDQHLRIANQYNFYA